MGAEYLFYMKSIETHARAFLALIILGIGTVYMYISARLFKNKIPRRYKNLVIIYGTENFPKVYGI